MILDLYVENYKSIEETSLSFGRLNVLIGKNGAGKTTLVSVISMLKEIASGKNINTIINEVAPYGEIFNANTNSNTFKIKTKIQTTKDHLFEYSFSIGFGPKHDDQKNDAIGSKFYFVDEKLSIISKENNRETTIFERNVEYSGIMVGDVRGNIPQRVASGVSVLSTYSQDQVREVAETLSSYSIIWMEHGPSSMNTLQFANDLDLSTIDGIAVGLYLKNKSGYNEAMNIIGEIISGFIPPVITQLPLDNDDDSSSAQSSYFVRWYDSNYARKTPVSSGSISGGNYRVIYLVLSLFYSEAKTCFVAEEIENGMHARRLSGLMDKLKMIGKNRKMQLFFTTHNHLILNELLPREVILAKINFDSGSTYTRLSDTSEYEDIRAELGRDPTGKEIADSGLLF